MSKSGFDKLGSALSSYVTAQSGIVENVPTNPDNPYDFSALGKFQASIDKTEERRYLQSGMVRNIRPQSLEILMQEPEVVVLVKKRQFSSLAENYRYDLMNDQEKNYIRTIKRLFYNKCIAISAYEQLSKIERIVETSGQINDYVLPQIFNSVDILNSVAPGLISGNTLSTIDTLKQVKDFSSVNYRTTWLSDVSIPYLADVGEGTGVFELCLVTNLQTGVGVKFGSGNFSFSCEDPYNLMIITTADIEKAISDSVGFTNNPFFNTAQGLLTQTINDLKASLAAARAARGAPAIKFIQDDNSLVYKKVRAIIDETGVEILFTFDGGVLGFNSSVALDASATIGPSALQGDEVDLFTQIVSNIYLSLGMLQTRKNSIKQFNKENNFLRERMMLEFDGKAIIQAMDSVHIFISSKTVADSRISQGFNATFSSDNLLNKIDTAIGSVDSSLDNIIAGFSGATNQGSFAEQEKDVIAGPDFPLWLWMLMRADFTRQSAGVQVTQGVVDSVVQSYNNGSYTLQVQCRDNTKYLMMGNINIKPSVAAFNASLYDPLTPFDTDFDASSGFLQGQTPTLLDENIALLNNQSVKAKSGRNKGLTVTQDSYFLKDIEIMTPENPENAKFRVKYNDPDGLVYRWKRGIGSVVLSGAPHNFGTGSLRDESSPTITVDPFAGQDVMNVLSLLVTGQPYNYNTFMRAAVNSGQITKDKMFNESLSESFLKGLITGIDKNNAVWGGFMPFKKVTINNQAYNFLKSGAFDITQTNQQLNTLLQQRATMFDQLATIFPSVANNPQFYKPDVGGAIIVDQSVLLGLDKNSLSTLAGNIIDLDLQIQQQQQDVINKTFQANISPSQGQLKIVGDDISFDPTVADNSAVDPTEQAQAEADFRKKLFILTQRRFERIKANNDINYFIVDDSYDKNYDIQAFEATIQGSLETFNSTFTTVGDKISTIVEKLFGLEIFADTQGHINARPPAYNRIPSSVFYNMISQKNTQGVQIFPAYLESLFFNQVQGLTDKISITEDQIRLRCAVLGYTTDAACVKLLSGYAMGGTSASGIKFVWLTNEADGQLGGADLRNLLNQATPDFMQEVNQKALSDLSGALKYPANATINFDLVKRTTVVNSTFNINSDQVSARFNLIADRLKSKNASVPTKADLAPNDKSQIGRGFSQADALSITNQLASLLSDRQYSIKTLANSVKNLEQGVQVNSDPSIADGSLFSSLGANTNFPEILQHMIEDEDIDDLGVNSGKRFIIKNSDIISFTITENQPPFTAVEVHGELDNNIVQGPSGLETGTGGNFIASASAVDYDMWRLYGFRSGSPVSVPFFQDPESQCAPYAVYLLNLSRKEIFSATLTMRGNEFIQPGEVYYIEHRDMLFYCEEVSHNFSYGSTFTTTLRLTFGHKPGQFIPTQLDIIGKGLYSNRNQSDLVRHVRNDDPTGNIPITVIVNDSNSSFSPNSDATITSDSLDSLVSNSFGEQNRKNLATISLSTTGLLTPTQQGNQLKIEIRIYFNSKTGSSSADTDLVKFSNGIKDWLINPSKFSLMSGGSTVPDNSMQPSVSSTDVNVVQVDLGDTTSGTSPSSQAWSIANALALNSVVSASDAIDPAQLSDAKRDCLFTKVIDVWAIFSDADPITLDSYDQSTPATNQNDQMLRAKYLSAFNAKLGIS